MAMGNPGFQKEHQNFPGKITGGQMEVQGKLLQAPKVERLEGI